MSAAVVNAYRPASRVVRKLLAEIASLPLHVDTAARDHVASMSPPPLACDVVGYRRAFAVGYFQSRLTHLASELARALRDPVLADELLGLGRQTELAIEARELADKAAREGKVSP